MKTEKYFEQQKRLPSKGKQIIGYRDGENIIVYQAFNPLIAAYAVSNQKFGGPAYSYNRMSWIKPGFLWMMHRAGWASKENQQHILAISLPMVYFKEILREATITSFDKALYNSEEKWKEELERTEVRLQWDPDHDPYGNKQERKAIQIGIKGDVLKKFCTEWIDEIKDVTEFVKQEYQNVLNNTIESLNIPFEEVIELNDETIQLRIGIDKE